jgi:hypothetical protein
MLLIDITSILSISTTAYEVSHSIVKGLLIKAEQRNSHTVLAPTHGTLPDT